MRRRVIGGYELVTSELAAHGGVAHDGGAHGGAAHGGVAHDGVAHDGGTTPRPTVLLVHGVGVSARYFVRLARELSSDAVVLAPDLVGFGRSPRTCGPLTIEQHADVVAGLLDQVAAERLPASSSSSTSPSSSTPTAAASRVGPEQVMAPSAASWPPLLVGHSMGTQVVTELAVRRPDLCGGLVLLGPVVDPAAPSPAAQGGRLLLDAFREPLSGVVMEVGEWLRTGVRWYLRAARRMSQYRLEERLPLVSAPVVLVRGAADPVASPGFVHRLAAEAADARVVEVPGAAHLVMWSRPSVVADLCRARLRAEP